MLITGIKSRPVYDRLAVLPRGKFHLVAGQGSGGSAMVRLLGEMEVARTPALVLYSTESFTGQNHLPAIKATQHEALHVFDSNAALVDALDQTLGSSFMGMRLYLGGSESFIGSAMKVADKYDLLRDEVLREHCGSLVRRVWCVHCDQYSENVTKRVFVCAGCGRNLIVRDHYSRYLGTFMGVQADAEIPGELPDSSDLDN